MNSQLVSERDHYAVSVSGEATGLVSGGMHHRLVITEQIANSTTGHETGSEGVYFTSFGGMGAGTAPSISFSDTVFLDVMQCHVALAEFGMLAKEVRVSGAMVEKIVKGRSVRKNLEALLLQVASWNNSGSSLLTGIREILSNESAVEMTVPSLAREIGMSGAHFSRRFSAEVEISPSTYLREVRLGYARSLLIRSKLPLVEIAMECGFSDQPHFTRVFRKRFAITPARYAKKFAFFSK